MDVQQQSFVSLEDRLSGLVNDVNDYVSRCSDLDIEDRRFLAGVIFARGKLYIGRTKRGSSFRYAPMLTVELSMPLPRHFEAFFDGPYERRYYGTTVLRYALQDTEKIKTLLVALRDDFPNAMNPRVRAMVAFCDGQDKTVAYERFAAL